MGVIGMRIGMGRGKWDGDGFCMELGIGRRLNGDGIGMWVRWDGDADGMWIGVRKGMWDEIGMGMQTGIRGNGTLHLFPHSWHLG